MEARPTHLDCIGLYSHYSFLLTLGEPFEFALILLIWFSLMIILGFPDALLFTLLLLLKVICCFAYFLASFISLLHSISEHCPLMTPCFLLYHLDFFVASNKCWTWYASVLHRKQFQQHAFIPNFFLVSAFLHIYIEDKYLHILM